MMSNSGLVAAAAVTALLAVLLVSCNGEAEQRYPPFAMTYQISGFAVAEVWELDYKSADDWTKTLVGGDNPERVGLTARWNGDRIAWAESSAGPFVADESPDPLESHAFPERWFGYDLPTGLFEEVDDQTDGVLTFRSDYPVEATGDEERGLEIVTVDEGTRIPVRYLNAFPLMGTERFVALSLIVDEDGEPVDRGIAGRDAICGPDLCQSRVAMVASMGKGVDVTAWGFLPDKPVVLRSTDSVFDGVEQHVYPDGSVRVWISPDSPRPPLEEYALIQEHEGELPTMRVWRLYVVEAQPFGGRISEFMRRLHEEYVDPLPE